MVHIRCFMKYIQNMFALIFIITWAKTRQLIRCKKICCPTLYVVLSACLLAPLRFRSMGGETYMQSSRHLGRHSCYRRHDTGDGDISMVEQTVMEKVVFSGHSELADSDSKVKIHIHMQIDIFGWTRVFRIKLYYATCWRGKANSCGICWTYVEKSHRMCSIQQGNIFHIIPKILLSTSQKSRGKQRTEDDMRTERFIHLLVQSVVVLCCMIYSHPAAITIVTTRYQLKSQHHG